MYKGERERERKKKEGGGEKGSLKMKRHINILQPINNDLVYQITDEFNKEIIYYLKIHRLFTLIP